MVEHQLDFKLVGKRVIGPTHGSMGTSQILIHSSAFKSPSGHQPVLDK